MIVGIDLGTTFSAIAYEDAHGRLRLVSDADHEEIKLCPSVVAFLDDKAFAGYSVEKLLKTQPNLFHVRFFKQFFGMRKVLYTGTKGEQWYPETIAAVLLKKMLSNAFYEFGKEVEAAVITVPAHFNDKQRKTVLNAAQLADLMVLGLIEEPIAAALHYGVVNEVKDEIILVYDLGGGTFDASIIIIEEGKLCVLAKDGITALGGKFFDEKIVQFILNVFERKFKKEYHPTASSLLELYRIAEEVKKELSQEEEGIVHKAIAINDEVLEVYFHREDFEKWIEPSLAETYASVKRALKGALLGPEDIDQILLVGGSTYISFIEKGLRGLFPDTNLQHIKRHQPMEAVAYGAYLHAQQLSGRKTALAIPPELRGVSGYNIGIKTINDYGITEIDVLIKKNLPLPITNKRTYYTTSADQQRLRLEIFQFLDHEANAISLGEVMVPISIPRPNHPIKVVVEYTTNGTVSVKTYDAETGREMERTFDAVNEDFDFLLKQKSLLKKY